MASLLRRLLDDRSAQDLVEYALLVALVGLVGIAGWSLLQTRLGSAYRGYDSRTQNLYAPNDPIGTPTP